MVADRHSHYCKKLAVLNYRMLRCLSMLACGSSGTVQAKGEGDRCAAWIDQVARPRTCGPLVTPALSRGPAAFERAGKKRDPGSSPG